MALCETVASAALALVRGQAPDEPRHQLLVKLFRLMPLYRDAGDMAAWADACGRMLPSRDDGSQTARLLRQVYELGAMNLFARFEPAHTAAAYDALVRDLEQCGMRPTNHGTDRF